MKKNYRMISAAAAALLAVAPVASSVVSTVSAADAPAGTTNSISITPGQTDPTTAKPVALDTALSVTNTSSLKAGDPVSSVAVNLTSTSGTAKISGKVYVFEKSVYDGLSATDKVNDTVLVSKAANKLDAGKTYVVIARGVTVSGLTAGNKYMVNGASEANATTADAYGNIGNPFDLESTGFKIPDTTKKGTPFFTDSKSKIVTKGSVELKSTGNTVAGVVSDIKGAYTVNVDNTSTDKATADWDDNTLTADVNAALKAAGVTITSGTFNKPVADVHFNTTVTADNGKTATLAVTLSTGRSAANYDSYPEVSFLGQKVQGPSATIDLTKKIVDDKLVDVADGDVTFNYVKVGGAIDTAAMAKAITANVNKAMSIPVNVSFDTSKVNTNVAGVYPVTATAVNPSGLATVVKFDLTVGEKGVKYSTVQYETGMSVPVYTINGNTVTTSTDTVANGTQVAVFGTVTVGGKSYTRINSDDSDKFIESKYVDGSYKPQASTTKTVMHASKVYDKTGKATGEHVKTYASIKVYGDKIKLDDGNEAYQIGDNKYVRADNIDGHTVTLNHNSYIYKTSKKRTTFNGSKKLMKGDTVTVFGNPVTLKNGVKYYRIGNKKFIKAVNAD